MKYTIKLINPQIDYKTNQQKKDTYGNPKWAVTVTDEQGVDHTFNKGWKNPRAVGEVLMGRIEDKTGEFGAYKQFVEDKEPFQGGNRGGSFTPKDNASIERQTSLIQAVNYANGVMSATGKSVKPESILKTAQIFDDYLKNKSNVIAEQSTPATQEEVQQHPDEADELGLDQLPF